MPHSRLTRITQVCLRSWPTPGCDSGITPSPECCRCVPSLPPVRLVKTINGRNSGHPFFRPLSPLLSSGDLFQTIWYSIGWDCPGQIVTLPLFQAPRKEPMPNYNGCESAIRGGVSLFYPASGAEGMRLSHRKSSGLAYPVSNCYADWRESQRMVVFALNAFKGQAIGFPFALILSCRERRPASGRARVRASSPTWSRLTTVP